MTRQRACTTRLWALAVNLAAVLGWALIVGPYTLPGGLGALLPAAFFGLPIAFVACWAFGAPMLWHITRKSVGWFAAAGWGAAIAAMMTLPGFAIARYQRWQLSSDPALRSRFGAGSHPRQMDGILAPYDWLIPTQSTVRFVLIGALVALMVRWIVGPGSSATDDR